jgi:hypothetical protein
MEAWKCRHALWYACSQVDTASEDVTSVVDIIKGSYFGRVVDSSGSWENCRWEWLL